MGDGVGNAAFEILKRIPASIARLRDKMVWRFDTLEARVDRLDLGMRKDPCNAAGMRVTRRATAGDFDARVSENEVRVAILESGAG
jgi:hypothetical protein